jgi:hypothetical protein
MKIYKADDAATLGRWGGDATNSARERIANMEVIRVPVADWVQEAIRIPNAALIKAAEEGTAEYAGFEDDVQLTQQDRDDLADSSLVPFSIADQPYLVQPYNSSGRRQLYMCARQVAKSTTVGNKIIAHSCLRPNFRTLYISPSETQTKRFSSFRVSDPIRFSPELQVFKGSARGNKLTDNMFTKRFMSDSVLTLSYARHNADRVRGLSADLLAVDELQDILAELLPVIRETLFTSMYKYEIYAGTPKSTDNPINYYWEERSTKYEWAMRCTHCNHWNITSMKNIGLNFLVCERCSAQLHPQDSENAEWVSARSRKWLNETDPNTRFEGYRIPQVVSPRVEWADVRDKLENYPVAEFMNEIMGLAHDSSDKLLPKEKILPNCLSGFHLKDGHKFAGRGPAFMGVDWGTGEAASYTLVTVVMMLGGKMQYVYFRRFLAHESHIDKLIPEIMKIVKQFNVQLVGSDYGGGYDKNYELVKLLGPQRVITYQYCGASLLYFDTKLNRFMVNRTEIIMRFVYAVYKKTYIRLPSWDSIVDPFMTDLLAVFAEMTRQGTRPIIQKRPGTSDDTLHSMIYAMLALLTVFPNPEILVPDSPR